MQSEDKSAIAAVFIIIGIWLFWIVVNLAFWGGLLFCAFHFLRKWW